MIRKDDRTPEQKKTHTQLVIGTDTFLSGWGDAKNGASYAAWACKPKDFDKVWKWVNDRSDMQRVRWAEDPYYPNPNLCAHLHIYVVNDSEDSEYPHPALI